MIAVLTALLFGFIVGIMLLVGLSRAGKVPAALPPQAERPEMDPQTVEVLSALREAVVVVGTHNNILFCAPQARNFGVVRGTRLGIPEVFKMVEEVRRSRSTAQRDLEVPRGYGVPNLQLTVRASFIHPEEVLIVVHEVGAMNRVGETRRDFIANVTHELKTPVGALSILAEAISEAGDDPEAVDRFASRIKHESVRLSELVSQIINLSRLQSDEPLLCAEEVSMDEVVYEAVSRCSEKANMHSSQVSVSVDSDAVVLGDAAQLVDAISNLVTNAISYSDDGSRVVVTCQRVFGAEDEEVVVSVADNGIGIKSEDLERIFERFYRVDYARSRDRGGTGLGLSIVRHIVAGHGGTVSVWSQPGNGSTFTLRFPAYFDEESLVSDKDKDTTRLAAV